jgi:hypothetical protein
MELKVTVDASEALAGLDELQKRQIPFALAKTLTGCAKRGQTAVQESLGGKFTLRNKFTQQGIRIKPADKKANVIEADVHTDTANRKSGAPDYLLGQDEGAEKTPYGGHSYIAVPTRYFRQKFGNGVIRAELRPRNLLGAVRGRYTTINRKGQIALKNQKIVAGYVFFIQDLNNGHKAIMGRDADGHDPEPFYFLISEAKIKPVLEMEKTVDAAVQKAFPELWQETWRSIMVRGLKIQG